MTVPDPLAYARRVAQSAPNLERMLTSEKGFNLTQATPLQRIICRLADGLPLGDLASAPLLPHPERYAPEIRERATLEWALGRPPQPGKPPAELYVLAGIRGGKSLLAAAIGVCATQRCELERLGPGEVPRVSIVSLALDLASVIHQHTVGRVQASARLRQLLLCEPTSDTVTLKHPRGSPVEIKTAAGARAGASLVARWSAGAIFDEFPRMVGAADGVVNFDDARSAVSGRLLPGAQIVGIGSPWAPFGPAYDLVQTAWQKPTAERIVVRGVAPAMNPSWWTPERCEELKRRNPTAYRCDVLGEFADAETSLFSQEELAAVTRRDVLELAPRSTHHYVAAIDPATRSNAFTLVVFTRLASGKRAQAMAREWVPADGKPLSPDAVLREIAETLRPYRVRRVATDQWAADALRDIGVKYNLFVDSESITSARKVELFESLHTYVVDKSIELAPYPELLEDLRRVRKRITQTGVAIELPRVGGRHCDYASATALAAAQPCPLPEPESAGLPSGWTQEELDEADATARRLRPRTPFGPEPGEGREDDDEWWNTPEEID